MYYSATYFFRGDDDLLGIAAGLILRGHLKNPIHINLESYLYLRNPSRGRWETVQRELA